MALIVKGAVITGFETSRLTVRDWADQCADDPQLLYAELLGLLTPEVLHDLPPSMALGQGLDAVRVWVAARAAESDVFTVHARQGGPLLGLLILVNDSEAVTQTLHLGYLFAQTAWGHGFASELVTGVIAALADHTPVRLSGGVAVENPASARVLQKQGFVMDAGVSSDDTRVYVLDI